MHDPICLTNGLWRIDICPAYGASITRAEYKGRPVFRTAGEAFFETGDVFQTSYFPMIPYSNRIENGQFEFDGQLYEIPRNREDQIYPIHGNGWSSSWAVDKITDCLAVLSLDYKPGSSDWPWAYRATETIEIHEHNFIIDIAVENTDKLPWPAGIGMHPYFANAQTAKVQFISRHMWNCRPDLIPTMAELTPWQDYFRRGGWVHNVHLDNCFENWGRELSIQWSDRAEQLYLKASHHLSNLVVYMSSDNDFFCVEPVSHINNALNIQGAFTPQILLPSEVMRAQIEIKLD